MSDAWFEGWNGESTEELLALADRYRIDSLVLAFEQAIEAKAATGPINTEERYVLAVEALEREVNNGGYNQFFCNSSNEYLDVIVPALTAIGCERTAQTTARAIRALGVQAPITPEAAQDAAMSEDPQLEAELGACDDQYFSGEESIADNLFRWIGENRTLVRIGGEA